MMVKQIRIIIDDSDYQELLKLKQGLGAKSWTDFILMLIGKASSTESSNIINEKELVSELATILDLANAKFGDKILKLLDDLLNDNIEDAKRILLEIMRDRELEKKSEEKEMRAITISFEAKPTQQLPDEGRINTKNFEEGEKNEQQ